MKCGLCVPQDPAKQRDRLINSALKKDFEEDNKWLKLLLLGTGESGKSTVTKQMRILHIDGFSDQERIHTVHQIKHNIMESIVTILGAMNKLHIELENSHLQSDVDCIIKVPLLQDYDYPQEFFERTKRLWQDGGVQECFMRSSEYQLIDSAKYFLDKLDEVRMRDYLPSNQDILRCRKMTTQIQSIEFQVPVKRSTVSFRVFDVGGQRGARKQWIQCFDRATAILFVADISSYDQTLREDESKNRLLEAMEIFEQAWESRFLPYVSIILFLNKIDVLKEKIKYGKRLQAFIDDRAMLPADHKYYEYFQTFHKFQPSPDEKKEFLESLPEKEIESGAPSGKRRRTHPEVNDEYVKTAVFLKRLFWRLASRSEHKFCVPFYTCAVDTRNIQRVLDGCRSTIIQTHLARFCDI